MACGGENVLETSMSVVEDKPDSDEEEEKSNTSLLRAQYHEFEDSKRLQNESIIEWFDRSVESELQKRRHGVAQAIAISPGLRNSQVLDAAASGIDIITNLDSQPDTELSEAVDKFAKAEAIVAFEGAVRAAEQAAASAPPELAEEAAVAGAKGYQAELTSVVNQEVPGSRPIEVIGYVGITKPTHPYAPSTRKN